MTNSLALSRTDVEALIARRVPETQADPVALIGRFADTFDPKTPPYHLPIRLYPFQRELVAQLKQAIEQGHELLIETCREVGATYTVLDVVLWFWLYIADCTFLLGSRKQDYVDNTGSSEVSNKKESLFGKLEYTLRRLPDVMLPRGFDWKRHLTFMSLINPENGNVISGESFNPNVSPGSRRTAILLDELAFWESAPAAWGSTADTTRCRIVLTTPAEQSEPVSGTRRGSRDLREADQDGSAGPT